MILFWTGYNRTPKVIDNITGLYEDWDWKNQYFKGNNKEILEKNKSLLDLKTKYLKIAEGWESEGIEWSPIQWSHSFEQNLTGEPPKEKVKVLPFSQCMDIVIENIKARKRLKNGIFITSTVTAEKYSILTRKLEEFTKEKYGKSLSSYYFKDIGETFIKDFVLHLQERGVKNGNKASLRLNLTLLYGVFCYTGRMGQPHTDKRIFKCVESHFKKEEQKPQTISYEWICKIEDMDKKQFTKIEQFHIDLFLFSFYCGGIAPVDMCFLKWDSFNEDKIIYERAKFPKKAEVLYNNYFMNIIRKYSDKCYNDYVLPIFNHKQINETQKLRKLKLTKEKVNKTLKKVAEILKLNKEFTWYAARATFITKMIDEGYHPVEVANMTGNSPQTIYKHYWKQTNVENVTTHMNQMFSRKTKVSSIEIVSI